ncbi:MAG: nucleotidyl transferase AbiEii/AbiGii toxin family protein [Clostridiaceae bacterium]|nr:nucleotidyl transferase AbiEii/AbiGii toxin family protein [Clostridiaceae bacterium]
MQNYMLERLLERISMSKYYPHFILKGGFLIAAMVGLDTRATMDMDATIKGIPLTKETLTEMFEEICKINVGDDVVFSFERIGEIREDDEYSGYRITLNASYPPMAVPLKLDITTGDKITPKEIIYEFRLLLEERSIRVLAYNLETVLAEKLETVISRGDQNTRARDFYDIYILQRLQGKNIENMALKAALSATADKRNSSEIMERYDEIITAIENSNEMQKRWADYQKDFDYAEGITFEDVCGAIRELLNTLQKL